MFASGQWFAVFASGQWFAVCALLFCTFPHFDFLVTYRLISLFLSVHTYISLCAISLAFVFLFSLIL